MVRKRFFSLCLLLPLAAGLAGAQTPGTPPQDQQQETPSSGRPGPGRGGPMEGHGVIGRITAINNQAIELTLPDGTSASVKLTDKTEFRKDRQPAKISAFKVGEFIFVRGDQNADHVYVAQLIAGRSSAGPEGGRAFGQGGFAGVGEMGKDFVVGEVKSIDAPKLTVLRPDNVTETLELNEETSLRKGRDSITMADIQPGDHLVARGALQNNVFVPKNVVVLSPEQWQRMQEMGWGPIGPNRTGTANAPKSASPPEH